METQAPYNASRQTIHAGQSQAPATRATQEYHGLTVQRSAELAAIQTAEAAKAEIVTQYGMAQQFPRSVEGSRVSLVSICQNLRFAESAKYKKPVGKKQNERGEWVQNYVEGLSIRFAEEAMRSWQNCASLVKQLYDDENQRIIGVAVIDFEARIRHAREIHIQKTIERKSAKGREGDIIAERLNTKGERVFILRATEDEVRNRIGAEVSKAIRDSFLRMLPAHIKQECLETLEETPLSGIDRDPEAYKRKIANSFAAIGVSPEQLEKYLGQPLSTLSPSQIQLLRDLHTAISTGETTWAEVLKEKDEDEGDLKKKEPEKGKLSNLKPGDESKHTHVSEPVMERQIKKLEPAKAEVVAVDAAQDSPYYIEKINLCKTDGELAEVWREFTKKQFLMSQGEVNEVMYAMDEKQNQLKGGKEKAAK